MCDSASGRMRATPCSAWAKAGMVPRQCSFVHVMLENSGAKHAAAQAGGRSPGTSQSLSGAR